MRSALGHAKTSVVDRLLGEPYRFGFFQALRMLEVHFARRGDASSDVLPKRVRFRNSLSLTFPASEIEALRALGEEGQELSSVESEEGSVPERIELTPAFFGLLGSQGVLPLHYTEKIVDRELYVRDKAARAFLDIFTNRAAALFYEAWKKYRLHIQYETQGNNRFLPLLLALAGLGHPVLRGRMENGDGAVFDETIARFGATFGGRPVSAESMKRILTQHFGVPIEIEQFVGRWYPVPREQRSALGGMHACLGHTALVGERVWQRDLRMRLFIGPLGKAQYREFLPQGAAARALSRLLHLMTSGTLEFEVIVSLRKEDVAPLSLGNSESGALGWDSFLVTEDCASDRRDTCYELFAIH
jgi:type VI secretion system protein ImpH